MTMESAPKQLLLPERYSYHPEGYLWFVLPVEKFVALPETVEIDNETFIKKLEFHVTVINARKVAQEIAGEDLKAVANIELRLQTLLSEYLHKESIKFIGFEDDLRLAVSNERTSIAARCTMQGIEGYFESVQSLYGVMPPAQPAHVSIYTVTGAAVGIDTTEQMESFKKLELPEIEDVLNSIH